MQHERGVLGADADEPQQQTDDDEQATADELDDVIAHYEAAHEDVRLADGIGELELLRTQQVLRRHLPRAPARIVDIGGGTGIHAAWLLAEVGAGKRTGDDDRVGAARVRVDAAEHGLGERGTPWWELDEGARRVRWEDALCALRR